MNMRKSIGDETTRLKMDGLQNEMRRMSRMLQTLHHSAIMKQKKIPNSSLNDQSRLSTLSQITQRNDVHEMMNAFHERVIENMQQIGALVLRILPNEGPIGVPTFIRIENRIDDISVLSLLTETLNDSIDIVLGRDIVLKRGRKTTNLMKCIPEAWANRCFSIQRSCDGCDDGSIDLIMSSAAECKLWISLIAHYSYDDEDDQSIQRLSAIFHQLYRSSLHDDDDDLNPYNWMDQLAQRMDGPIMSNCVMSAWFRERCHDMHTSLLSLVTDVDHFVRENDDLKASQKLELQSLMKKHANDIDRLRDALEDSEKHATALAQELKQSRMDRHKHVALQQTAQQSQRQNHNRNDIMRDIQEDDSDVHESDMMIDDVMDQKHNDEELIDVREKALISTTFDFKMLSRDYEEAIRLVALHHNDDDDDENGMRRVGRRIGVSIDAMDPREQALRLASKEMNNLHRQYESVFNLTTNASHLHKEGIHSHDDANDDSRTMNLHHQLGHTDDISQADVFSNANVAPINVNNGNGDGRIRQLTGADMGRNRSVPPIRHRMGDQVNDSRPIRYLMHDRNPASDVNESFSEITVMHGNNRSRHKKLDVLNGCREAPSVRHGNNTEIERRLYGNRTGDRGRGGNGESVRRDYEENEKDYGEQNVKNGQTRSTNKMVNALNGGKEAPIVRQVGRNIILETTRRQMSAEDIHQNVDHSDNRGIIDMHEAVKLNEDLPFVRKEQPNVNRAKDSKDAAVSKPMGRQSKSKSSRNRFVCLLVGDVPQSKGSNQTVWWMF